MRHVATFAILALTLACCHSPPKPDRVIQFGPAVIDSVIELAPRSMTAASAAPAHEARPSVIVSVPAASRARSALGLALNRLKAAVAGIHLIPSARADDLPAAAPPASAVPITPPKIDPSALPLNPSNVGSNSEMIFDAIQNGHYGIAALVGLALIMWIVYLKFGNKWAFLQTHMGIALSTVALGLVGSLANALMAGGVTRITWPVFFHSLTIAIGAGGGLATILGHMGAFDPDVPEPKNDAPPAPASPSPVDDPTGALALANAKRDALKGGQ